MNIRRTPQEIVLYGHPMCGWCQEAKFWLDERGWKYTSRNTGTDPTARQRAIDLSGQTFVPVIEIDGLILGDFDTGQLEQFLQTHGYLE